MDINVYSMVFQSKMTPDRIALVSMIAKDSAEALDKGLNEVINKNGDLGWISKLATHTKITPAQPVIANKEIQQETGEDTFDKNWVMNSIVENKDKKLFTAVSQYLGENEIKYLQENLNDYED